MTPAEMIDHRLDSAWLRDACARMARGEALAVETAWGEAARRVGRAALSISAEDAGRACSGWDPSSWTADQLARARLLLALPTAGLGAQLDRLAANSTVDELVALYQALPLLPDPPSHARRAAEGVRSNMLPVFRAVALDNPYPVAHLDDEAWSQMVLKCFFTQSDCDRIIGLRTRLIPRLRGMLADYARERTAAKRPIDPRIPALIAS